MRTYLGFSIPQGTKVSPKNVFITVPPLNSSGDIYHVLAYLLLVRANNRYTLPMVLLAWDFDRIKPQVNRSYHFLQTFGFNNWARVIQLTPTSCTRLNARSKNFKETLSARASQEKITIVALDQMACTAIIAHQVRKHGFATITSRIRNELNYADNTYYPDDIREAVNQYVSSEIEAISKYRAQNQPLIVLHIRHSSGTNEHQNLPDNFILKIRTYLEEKGFCVWHILADSREHPPTYSKEHESTPFSSPLTTKPINQETYEYGKHKHLQLLLALYKLTHDNPNNVRLVGNTSGTLDIATFIGLQVFNIHQFSNGNLDYQGYRIMLQTVLMHVDDFDPEKLKSDFPRARKATSNKVITTMLPNLAGWLEYPNTTSATPRISYYSAEKKPLSYDKKRDQVQFGKMMEFSIFTPKDRSACENREPLMEAERQYKTVIAILTHE